MLFETLPQLPPSDPELAPLPIQIVADQIFADLDARKNVWVHGPGHAGRTTLAASIEERLTKAGCTPLRVRLSTILSKDTATPKWAQKLDEGLRAAVSSKRTAKLRSATQTSDASELLGGLLTALKEWMVNDPPRELAAPGVKVGSYALLIEDFDAIVKLDDGSLLYNFIHELIERTKGHLVVCVISILRPSDLRIVFGAREGSRTLAEGDLWQLTKLDDLTTSELVTVFRPKFPADDDLIDLTLNAVHRWTGGHFWMSQRLCYALKSDWGPLGKQLAPGPNRRDAVDAVVEEKARSLLLRTEISANFDEINEVMSTLEWATTLRFRDGRSMQSSELIAAARVLHDGTPGGPNHQVALVILKLAGLAKQKDDDVVLRENRILESLFSPERLVLKLSGDAATTPEKAQSWLATLGAAPAKAVDVIRQARKNAEREADGVSEELQLARKASAQIWWLVAILSLLLLSMSATAWVYEQENTASASRHERLEAALKTENEGLRQATLEAKTEAEARSTKLQNEVDKRKAELASAAAAAASEANKLMTAKENAEKAAKAEAAAGSSDRARLAAEAKTARAAAEAAQRNADAADQKRRAAEDAKQSADAAAQAADAAQKQLALEVKAQLATSDGARLEAVRALTAEAARRKASELELDAQRNKNAVLQKDLDACVSEKKKAEAVVGGGSAGTGP